MNISNALTVVGGLVGLQVGMAGAGAVLLATGLQREDRRVNDVGMATILAFTAGGMTIGSLAGKVTGVVIEKAWGCFVRE